MEAILLLRLGESKVEHDSDRLSPLAKLPLGRATAVCDGASSGAARIMDDSEILRRLELLRVEHRDLDAAIEALVTTAMPDQLQIARLKKRKLLLRDEIAMLEDQLIPDIIA
jgi:hypothetical protein